MTDFQEYLNKSMNGFLSALVFMLPLLLSFFVLINYRLNINKNFSNNNTISEKQYELLLTSFITNISIIIVGVFILLIYIDNDNIIYKNFILFNIIYGFINILFLYNSVSTFTRTNLNRDEISNITGFAQVNSNDCPNTENTICGINNIKSYQLPILLIINFIIILFYSWNYVITVS